MRAHSVRLWLLLAVAATPGAAQSSDPGRGVVRGTVRDAARGEALAAATVRIPHLHRSDETHDDGRFELTDVPPGALDLVVQRIGYRPATVTVQVRAGDTATVEVRLTAAALELPATVVTGTLGERAREEALSPTAVLSGAQLDGRLTETVAATLQDEPGVALTSLGPATGRPVLRGLGGDRIIMLEDGQRSGDMSSMSADHAVAVEPLTARQMEVVRGPMSLLYGSSALGGVVNVIRDEVPNARPDHAHGTLSVQGTSMNWGGGVGGYGTAPLGALAVRAEASARGAGDMQTVDSVLDHTSLQTYTFGVGAGLAGRSGHVGAAYRYYDSYYGIPGGFVGGHPQGVDIDMQRHVARVEGERHREGSTWHALRGNFGFTNYHHSELEASGAVGTVFDQQVGVLDLRADHERLGPWQGSVGVRAQYRDINSSETVATYDWSLAGFVVEGARRGPLEVQGGLRYDWASYVPRDSAVINVGGQQVPVVPRTFGSLSGSLGALYEVAPGVRVGASLSRAYRTPDFNELYADGPHLAANSYDVGDPSLDAEHGVGADAWVRINRGAFDGELAAFWNAMAGYIFPSSRGRVDIGPQGGRPRFQYTNEDARFVGAEGELSWRALPWLVADASVSAVYARFTSPRDSIPVVTPIDTTFVPASVYPPLIPPLHGQLELRYDDARLFAGAGLRWSDDQERLGDFETRTAGYAVGYLLAGARWLLGERLHQLTLRVDNLGNTSYRNHLSRVKDLVPEPGRSVSVLYRLSF